MKVLLTTDAVGGVLIYSLDLARGLRRRGHEVYLAVLGPDDLPLDDRLSAEVEAVFRGDFKLEWMAGGEADLGHCGRWLLQIARELSPDIVHLNQMAFGHLSWPAPVLVVGHSCVLSWWEAVRGGSAPPSFEPYRRAVRRGLQGADAVVAPTAAMLASLDRHYGPFALSTSIHNGRESGRYAAAAKEPLVLSVGRLWDEGKNVAALEAVAGRLDWPIAIAGPLHGPEGQRVEPRQLCVLGSLSPDRLSSWYGRASIYCAPARYEPFGLSALEAALSGCALILGDLPSLREVWGENALYVRPNEPESLLKALRLLCGDRRLREELARKALQRARSLSLGAMVGRYEELYTALLDSNRPGTGHDRPPAAKLGEITV